MTTPEQERDKEKENRWYLSKERLENTPSRKAGIEPDKELSQRQQAANFIQDMGQRLQVTQLCINTAIVYMHRFYCFHSFSHFHRNAISPAAIFLAAKVEEQPRKLEHIIRVTQMLLQRNQAPLDRRSEAYSEQAQELVMNENILLMTLGFDVAIEHPHTFIVNFCHIVKASKDLSQTSYFMATNSLHLTTMCLQYKPAVVACFCIHLVCRWSNCQIPNSNENLPWYSYIDPTVTVELLEQLTNEFLIIFDKCPSRLKKRIQNSQVSCQNSLSGYSFDVDTRIKQSSADQSTTSSGSSSHHHHHHHHNPHHHHHQSQSQKSNDHQSQSSSSKGAHSAELKKPSGVALVSASRQQNQLSTSSAKMAEVSSNMNGTATNVHDQSKVLNTNSLIPSQPMAARPSASRQQKQQLNAFGSSHQQQQHPYKTNSNSLSGAHVPSSTSRSNRPSLGLSSHNSDNKETILRLEHLKKPLLEVRHVPGLTLPPTAVSVPPSTSIANSNNHHLKNGNAKSSSSICGVQPTTSVTSGNFKKENGLHQDNGNCGRFVSTTQSDIICNVVKEVALAEQYEKQRLSAAKIEPQQEDVKPTDFPLSAKVAAKSHSIFSPSPVGPGDSSFEDCLLNNDVTSNSEQSSTLQNRVRSLSSNSNAELIPIVKKVETIAAYENILERNTVSVLQPELKESRNTTTCTSIDESFKDHNMLVNSCDITASDATDSTTIPSVMDAVHVVKGDGESVSHSHKKKKKHKEKDKKHDKEKRYHHKEKKKHKEDKYRKEHKDRETFRPEHIKITIPKEKLMDIPVKKEKTVPTASSMLVSAQQQESPLVRLETDAAPVKLKIKIPKERHDVTRGESEQYLTSGSTVTPAECKLKISKDKVKSSRKRHRESDHEDMSKKYTCYGNESRNGY